MNIEFVQEELMRVLATNYNNWQICVKIIRLASYRLTVRLGVALLLFFT